MLFNPMAVRTPGAAKMFEGKSLAKRMGRLYFELPLPTLRVEEGDS